VLGALETDGFSGVGSSQVRLWVTICFIPLCLRPRGVLGIGLGDEGERSSLEDRVRHSFARARKDALGGRVGDGRHCFECCGLKSPQRVGGGVQSIRWCSRVSVLSGRDFFGPVALVLALDCRAAIELGLTQDCDGLTSGDVDDFWGIPSGWRKSACGETTLPATARLWTRSLVRRQRKRSHRWRRKALVL
jgi:hypothetical protein